LGTAVRVASEWLTIRELIVTKPFVDSEHKLISDQERAHGRYYRLL